jgi:hypothetical protein
MIEVALIAWFGGTGAEAMQAAREPMRVDGKCYSACAWSWASNPQACFTDLALFGFHGFRDPATDEQMPKATAYWMERVPPKLRQRLQGVGAQMIYIGSSEMAALFPERKCK